MMEQLIKTKKLYKTICFDHKYEYNDTTLWSQRQPRQKVSLGVDNAQTVLTEIYRSLSKKSPTGPTNERTPKKPEYLIARSQLTWSGVRWWLGPMESIYSSGELETSTNTTNQPGWSIQPTNQPTNQHILGSSWFLGWRFEALFPGPPPPRRSQLRWLRGSNIAAVRSVWDRVIGWDHQGTSLPETNSKSTWKLMVGRRLLPFGFRPIFRGDVMLVSGN